MEAVENIIEPPAARCGKLLKIPGVGFGLGVGIGATVGVEILRKPGGAPAQTALPRLIMTARFSGVRIRFNTPFVFNLKIPFLTKIEGES